MSIYEYDEEKQRQFDKEEGEERFIALTKLLLGRNELDELKLATENTDYRKQLYEKYEL